MQKNKLDFIIYMRNDAATLAVFKEVCERLWTGYENLAEVVTSENSLFEAANRADDTTRVILLQPLTGRSFGILSRRGLHIYGGRRLPRHVALSLAAAVGLKTGTAVIHNPINRDDIFSSFNSDEATMRSDTGPFNHASVVKRGEKFPTVGVIFQPTFRYSTSSLSMTRVEFFLQSRIAERHKWCRAPLTSCSFDETQQYSQMDYRGMSYAQSLASAFIRYSQTCLLSLTYASSATTGRILVDVDTNPTLRLSNKELVDPLVITLSSFRRSQWSR